MQDLTRGPITKNLLRMTSFMLVAMLFQTLYILVDLYFVGRLGKTAVAAVSVCGNLQFLVLAATQMLGVGTTALVSHAAGRKDRDTANRVFNQSQVLSMIVGATFFVVMMALRGGYARAMSADAETANQAAAYLGWFVPAMALQFALISTGSALRGIGVFQPGTVVQAGTVVINMVLAPVLIFGWGTGHAFGVAGAALATFIAVSVGVAALLGYVVYRQNFLKLAPATWRPDFKQWGRMLQIGLPAGAEFGLMGVYLAVVYQISQPFGSEAQAGFGIGLRVVQAGFLPVVALGFAVSPVAGQNFGARQPERVRATFRAGVKMAVAGMAVFTVVALAMPRALIGFFSKDPHVLAVGGEYLGIVCWTFVPSGIVFVSSSMFQSLGNTLPSLASSAARMTLIVVPSLALSRVPGFELRWVWYLAIASVVVQVTMNLLLLRRELARKLGPMASAAAATVAQVASGEPAAAP